MNLFLVLLKTYKIAKSDKTNTILSIFHSGIKYRIIYVLFLNSRRLFELLLVLIATITDYNLNHLVNYAKENTSLVL